MENVQGRCQLQTCHLHITKTNNSLVFICAHWHCTAGHLCFYLCWRPSLVSTYVVCERLLWCMSLLEWLKFWSKFYRIPLFWNTVSEYPLPPRKLKFGQILALWLFSFRIPPPPENWNLGRSWHFKTFQFQNYVWQVTTCGDFIQPG